MTTRSRVLAAGLTAGRITATVYTCPLGSVAIVKTIYVEPVGSSASDIFVSTRRPSSSNIRLLSALAVAPGALVEWQGWHVLEGTDYLELYFSAGPVCYWISGAVLPAGPP